MLKKFNRLLWIIYNVDHCPPALTECRQDSAFKMKIIMKDNRLFIMFTRFLWIIYNVDHWPHAQMPLPERVVKALRYNTSTNTEAQSLWSAWPKKKDILPLFSKLTSCQGTALQYIYKYWGSVIFVRVTKQEGCFAIFSWELNINVKVSQRNHGNAFTF